MRKRFLSLLVGIVGSLLLVGPVLAATYSYYIPVTVTETSGTIRDNIPILVDLSNSNLVTLGYLDADGLKTEMKLGDDTGPYSIIDSKLGLTIETLAGYQEKEYRYYTNYDPPNTSFDIITGLGGYITVPYAAALALGSNFEISMADAWIDTSVGVDKNLVYKQDEFRIYTGAVDEEITAGIYDYGAVYPAVEAITGGNEANVETNHTINMPAGVVAGDLLIVFTSTQGGWPMTFPGGAAWTQLYSTTSTNTLGQAFWKISDGGEGASITATTAGAVRSAHTSYRISGYSSSDVPEAVGNVAGNSANPNPPLLTPTWGSRATLWLAGAHYFIGTYDVNAYPANYTDGRNDKTNNAGGAGVGSARRENTTAAEDPGAFTLSTTDTWVASTIGIAPAWDIVISVTATGIASGEHTVEVGLELR